MEQYGPFLLTFFPNNGSYLLTDVNYGINIALVKIESGPGAVANMTFNTFLDVSQAQYLTHFLSDLNSTLQESP